MKREWGIKAHVRRSDHCRKSEARKAADAWCLAYQRNPPADDANVKTRDLFRRLMRETGCNSEQARQAWSYASFTLRQMPPLPQED
jgi:hypothetical protein